MWGVNKFAALVAGVTDAIDTLEHFDAQVLIDAGANPTRVAEWRKAYTAYYGKTRYTRQQANAIRIARETGKSLDQLVYIESCLGRIPDATEKWKVRLALLSVPGNYKALKRRAKNIVPDASADVPAPKPGVGFGASRGGMRPLHAMGSEKDMAALEYALRRNLTADGPAGPQMLETLMAMLGLRPTADAHASASDSAPAPAAVVTPAFVPPAVPRPLILIPLPDYVSILAGDGDETILGLSDGTTITGAEYLAKHHGAELEVATFHPQAGAVNMYRAERLANKKQRDLARATLTTCPVPGCRHASDNCELHHITAWSQGGPTNMNNLAVLCRYHNRTNDDDPDRKHRGRIENIRGAPTWISPRGIPVPNTVHPYGAMHALFDAH